jgi:N-acetylmuramoyl-L-alanine amidase
VLLGLHMAGVLVEVGFIDHPQEGPQLLEPAMQEAIAAALSSAIVWHLLTR